MGDFHHGLLCAASLPPVWGGDAGHAQTQRARRQPATAQSQNVGEVYPCGYLPVSAGSTRRERFADIWRASEVFGRLRDPGAFLGKCGVCRYQAICAGCRARAYYETGDYMDAEPFCTYEPNADLTI